MSPPSNDAAALFVFAHQDDEIAAASRIRFELHRGRPVFCAFLTDGGSRTPPGVRDRESKEVLTRIGVPPNGILFLGSEIPIPARTLVDHLDIALERLEQAMQGTELDRIYCLAWEGGNADHDASHLIAAAFARRRGILDQCREMPLYRAMGRSGPFFRALSPLPPRREWQMRRLSFREGASLSMLVLRYRSQRRSWIGLFPEVFLKLALMRRELVRNVDPSRYRRPPHPGALLYERRFRYPHESFVRAAAKFIEDHFPTGSAPDEPDRGSSFWASSDLV